LPDLKIEDLATGLVLSAVEPDALTMQRVPSIFDDDKTRSVC
jgi:hypothetical protein